MTDQAALPRDPDEERLAAGLSARDPAAVADFLRRSHGPVYGMASRLTRDPDLRHDWSHEVLLRVLREMGQGRFVYRRPGCFWAWFRTRANFILINLYHQRRRHTDRWTTGEIGAELAERMPLEPGADALDVLAAAEAARVLAECMDELPSADHRRALTLVMSEEQPYQAVADVMGAALNTVRSWVRRARIAVRRCVAERLGLPSVEEGGKLRE